MTNETKKISLANFSPDTVLSKCTKCLMLGPHDALQNVGTGGRSQVCLPWACPSCLRLTTAPAPTPSCRASWHCAVPWRPHTQALFTSPVSYPVPLLSVWQHALRSETTYRWPLSNAGVSGADHPCHGVKNLCITFDSPKPQLLTAYC